MNDAGQVASTWQDTSGVYHAVLYTPGIGFQDLGNLGGAKGSLAFGINNLGQIVGSSFVDASSENSHAYIYTQGTMLDIGTLPGGLFSEANAINDKGEVVGDSGTAAGGRTAFIYQNGTMQSLQPLMTTGSSSATAINNAGQVVGTESDFLHAFSLSKGIAQDLAPLSPNSVAVSINLSGQIVGTSTFSGSASSQTTVLAACLYSNGQTESLASLIGSAVAADSGANAISDAGQIVGKWSDASGNDFAFVYAGGQFENLNDVTSGLNGHTLFSAHAINRFGQILAYETYSPATYSLVVLTPVTTTKSANLPQPR